MHATIMGLVRFSNISILLTKAAFIGSEMQWNNNIVKYHYNLNYRFPFEYIVKCNLLLWSKLKHYYSSLQCHMILQKSF